MVHFISTTVNDVIIVVTVSTAVLMPMRYVEESTKQQKPCKNNICSETTEQSCEGRKQRIENGTNNNGQTRNREFFKSISVCDILVC